MFEADIELRIKTVELLHNAPPEDQVRLARELLAFLKGEEKEAPRAPKAKKTPHSEEAKAPSVSEPLQPEPPEKTKDAAPVVEELVVSYDDVKASVLDVAKNKGREASLDLLAAFGVVTGEGAARKGNIAALKPEQYAAVVKASSEAMA